MTAGEGLIRLQIRAAEQRGATAEDQLDPIDLDDGSIEDLLNAEEHLPRYRVLDRLGSGALARMLAVHDDVLDRDLACKVMDGSDPTTRKAWERERTMLARLSHPSIPPLLGAGEVEQLCWLSMPIVPGRSLQCRIDAQQWGQPRQAAAMLAPIAEALAQAHAQGVVHGDVSPGNIMLPDGASAVLVDWGQAVWRDAPEASGRSTPQVAAPELRDGRAPSPAADLYALGVCLRMLLGPERPPRALRLILDRCLAHDSDHRYQSATVLASDLYAFSQDEPVSVLREGPGRQLWRWGRRHPRSLLVVVTALVVTATFAVLLERHVRLLRRQWQPVLHEDFARSLDREQWHARIWPLWSERFRQERTVGRDDCPWHVVDGELRSRWLGDWRGAGTLLYQRLLGRDFRASWRVCGVESDANLNVILGSSRQDGYMIHVGGFDDPNLICVTDQRFGTSLMVRSARLPEPIRPGRWYRFELSVVDDRLRFAIDDHVYVDYRDPFGIGPGRPERFGFDTALNDLRIDDLRIDRLGLPPLVDLGHSIDRLFAAGLYREALNDYRSVAVQNLSADRQAWLAVQTGRCHAGLGNVEQAQRLWSQVLHQTDAAPGWRLAAMLLLLEHDDSWRRSGRLPVPLEAGVIDAFDREQRLLLFNRIVTGLPRPTDMRHRERHRMQAAHRDYAQALRHWGRLLHLELTHLGNEELAPFWSAWAGGIAKNLLAPDLPNLFDGLPMQLPQLIRQWNPAPERWHGMDASGSLPSIWGLLAEEERRQAQHHNGVRVSTMPTPSGWRQWRYRYESLLRADSSPEELQQVIDSLHDQPVNREFPPQHYALVAALIDLGRGQRQVARQRLQACLQSSLASRLMEAQQNLRDLLAGRPPDPGEYWWTGALGQALALDLAGETKAALAAYREAAPPVERVAHLIAWRTQRIQAEIIENR